MPSSRTEAVLAKVLAAVRAECQQWSEAHPETYTDKDGAPRKRTVKPTPGFVAASVRHHLDADELVEAFVADVAAAAAAAPEK